MVIFEHLQVVEEVVVVDIIMAVDMVVVVVEEVEVDIAEVLK